MIKQLIKSDNNQCVLASFAMVMNTTMENLEKRLGHNGLERVLDEAPEPSCFRSFHPQEFIDLLLDDGYAATMIELNPCLQHGSQLVNHAAFIGQDRFFQALLRGDGVIFGRLETSKTGHAVAWDAATATIHDPRGYSYRWNKDQDFNPRQFFLIQKVEETCMTTFTKPAVGS